MKNECSIFTQIQKAEGEIKLNYKRIEDLERKLSKGECPADKEDEIRVELKEIRKLLKTNEKVLSSLHKQNTRSFAVAAVLFFVCFLVYGLYILIAGKDF